MEKVLRKVNDKDPTITGWYLTDIGKIFYTTEFNHFFKNSLNLEKLYPEYWYEEVGVDELDDYKMLMKSNLHMREMSKALQEDDVKEANERYEKVFKYLESLNYLPNESNLKEEAHLIKALKMAAGLEEE